ncbi:hypothetical protein [Amycolatopsis rifamycinica]|uniref:Uncharacterized protein n=1 Tax=Amycolatopsis rifamycinica TaxID=287986 RepID=A0A066U0E2_9PSEU|nr:hypothetical protein [Amycolatopsis rifamycinica]KDN17584.1 hypothetical protein DV20_35235 [Amycolatopsis rifamycinica]
MIALTKAERATEPTTLLTDRLRVRSGRASPDAFVAVFALNAVLVIGLFGYLFLRLLPGVDRGDLPDGGYVFFVVASVLLTTWLHVRAGDRRAASRLGDRRVEDAHLLMPSGFAIPALADVVFEDLPGEPWLIGEDTR